MLAKTAPTHAAAAHPSRILPPRAEWPTHSEEVVQRAAAVAGKRAAAGARAAQQAMDAAAQ